MNQGEKFTYFGDEIVHDAEEIGVEVLKLRRKSLKGVSDPRTVDFIPKNLLISVRKLIMFKNNDKE